MCLEQSSHMVHLNNKLYREYYERTNFKDTWW